MTNHILEEYKKLQEDLEASIPQRMITLRNLADMIVMDIAVSRHTSDFDVQVDVLAGISNKARVIEDEICAVLRILGEE